LSHYTQSTISLEQIADRLATETGQIIVCTHAKPDGDAFGSVVAVVETLAAIGRNVLGVLAPPIPVSLKNLPGHDHVEVWSEQLELPQPAVVLIVDTGAWSQVGPLRPYIEQHLDQTIIIDHHLSGDIQTPDRHVEGEAAAACEIVAELVELLMHHKDGGAGIGRREGDVTGYSPLPAVVRDALFVGIASDTGWFRFSNTRPQTHELAAKLIRQGTDHAMLYQKLEQAERPEKLALLTRALDSLELYADGRAAVMILRQSDFEETGARIEETERLIDIPQIVESIQVFVVLTEVVRPTGQRITRMSFRSRHTGNDQAVNVAELAARFGGGGHARAAGAKVEQPIENVQPRLAEALEEL
jgi:phosphoesterase RecJ-like protein